MKLPNKIYDVLKWVALICLPALALLFNTVAPVWGVDKAITNAVVITINAIGTCIGMLIGVSAVAISKDESDH